MSRTFAIFVLASLLAGCSAEQAQDTVQPTPAAPPAQASNDNASSLAQLGPGINEAGFSIAPPQGYTRTAAPAGGGATIIAWAGERRSDGSAPMLQVSLIPVPQGQAVPSNQLALSAMLSGVARLRSSFLTNSPEAAQINGVEFLRQSWSGVNSGNGQKMDGVMYVTTHNNRIVALHTQDSEQRDASSRATCEASFTTFRFLP